MNERIVQALDRLFERHRIVFWYDAAKELRVDYEALKLKGVEKIEILNDEFGIKHRILRQQPKKKFLLYREGPQPADLENWLLDVQLANGEFRADQVALWLSELGLGYEFTDLVREHAEILKAVKRKDSLRRLLRAEDTHGQIRMKMVAVCVGAEPRLDSVMEHLLQELAEGRDEKYALLKRCQLEGYLWDQVGRAYGYAAHEPSVRDFMIELFKSCFGMATEGEFLLKEEAQVFLKRWKDSRQFGKSFERLSSESASALGIENDLSKRDFRSLVEIDYFRLIDQKIISDLVKAVSNRTVSSGDVEMWVRQRRQGYWYAEFEHLYKATEYASRFMSALSEATLSVESLTDGVERYARSWHGLDLCYRKFTYHVRMSGQATLLGGLSAQIENLYTNNYLLKLNDRWQTVVDQVPQWKAPTIPVQSEFFAKFVMPFLRKDNKVCVVISDALRYEVGNELVALIRQEDRYGAEIQPMLSMLPSYTQLGMAALLPNTELAIAKDDTGHVLVDGQSSQGTENRRKILEKALKSHKSAVLKSDELKAMKGDECRTMFRENDVVYVYHNQIDATGDKRDTEERVFEAVEDTLSELIQVIKKLTAANASNILVTSDHGFIYQNKALDESDFLGVEPSGEILFRDRRFVLGTGLKEEGGLRKFTPEQIGLGGSVEVQIPKSINRLRLKGSGSRFVHGGATLQEVVVPVIKVNKKRQSDTSVVDVEIIRGTSSLITSGQLAIVLYQKNPASEKVQPRTLRAGIFNSAGEPISDSHELTFDMTSENPREREISVRFVLTRKADESNGQDVQLRLEERHAGTSHFKVYKSLQYQLRRSFTSDFDF